jgi:hypothetical protein
MSLDGRAHACAAGPDDEHVVYGFHCRVTLPERVWATRRYKLRELRGETGSASPVSVLAPTA